MYLLNFLLFGENKEKCFSSITSSTPAHVIVLALAFFKKKSHFFSQLVGTMIYSWKARSFLSLVVKELYIYKIYICMYVCMYTRIYTVVVR